MKTTFLLFLLMAATVCKAQFNPCEIDLIGGGGSGVAAIDSSIVGAMRPRCTPCPTEGCAAWQLSSDTAFHIYLFSTQPQQVSLQIVTECNWLLFDTCATAYPTDPASPVMFFLGLIVPPNSQAIVCADIGDTIILQVKETAPANLPTYTIPIANLDTCSPPTFIPQPIEQPRQYWEFDGTYWRAVDAFKPNGLYKVCKSRK